MGIKKATGRCIVEKFDIYYEIIVAAGNFLSRLIEAYCYCYLIKPYMRNKGRIWTVGAVYAAVMYALEYMPYYIPNFCAYFIGVAAGFAVMTLLDRKSGGLKIYQKIFLSCSFFLTRWLALAMRWTTYEFINELLVKLVDADKNMTVYDDFAIFVCNSLIDVPLDFIFVFSAVWIIRKAYACGDEDLTRAEFVMLSIPMISFALNYNVKKFYEGMYLADAMDKDIFMLYRGHNFEFFVYYAFMLAAIPAIIMMYRKIKQAQEKELENERYAGQLESIKRHISEVEALYGDIRSLKHDMGNHIMTLECLYDKKDYEEAQLYLGKLKESFDRAAAEIKSGNPVTDVILMQGLKHAREINAEFLCDFHYSDEIDVFDLSIILNNALDNALSAAAECNQPYVKIASYRRGNSYMIEVKNSFNGSITYDETTGLPKTTKADKRHHGFGLESIRKTAQKYYGDIDISAEDGEFTLCVLLMTQ